jgi:hypothetical protein
MGVLQDASDDDAVARMARELACELSRDISRPRHPRRELARRTVLGAVAGVSTPHPPVATAVFIAAAIAAIMTGAAKRFDHCSRRARSCVATDADRRDAPVHGRDAGPAVRCQEGTAGTPMRHHRLRAPVQCDEGRTSCACASRGRYARIPSCLESGTMVAQRCRPQTDEQSARLLHRLARAMPNATGCRRAAPSCQLASPGFTHCAV